MSVNIQGLEEFVRKLEQAADGGLKRDFSLWLEAMGFEFLDLIQDEIIETKTTNTRRLLSSFDKSDNENFWSLNRGSLKLEIGTNLTYASYVNDGHWTNPEGVESRWVPGRWTTEGQNEYFEYDPSATTGMLLKQQWVDGSGYWDQALAIFEKRFEKSLERRLQQWLDTF